MHGELFFVLAANDVRLLLADDDDDDHDHDLFFSVLHATHWMMMLMV